MFKKELRNSYKSKRELLSKEEIRHLSFEIKNKLIPLLVKVNSQHINCFLSSEIKNEVLTQDIILWAWKNEIKVSVPQSNFKTAEITPLIYQPDNKLIMGKFGIPECNSNVLANIQEIDVILVPLLIFDSKGQRVGYGKGMYDLFLEKCPKKALKIGLSFFEVIDEITDTNPGDIPLDWVVTPNKVYQFNTTKSLAE